MDEEVRHPEGVATSRPRFLKNSLDDGKHYLADQDEGDCTDAAKESVATNNYANGMDLMDISNADPDVAAMSTDALETLQEAAVRLYEIVVRPAETEPSYGNVPSSGMIVGTGAPEMDVDHEISALGNVSSNGDDSGELAHFRKQARAFAAKVSSDMDNMDHSGDSVWNGTSSGSDHGKSSRSRRMSQRLTMTTRKSTANMDKWRKRLQNAKSTAFKQRLRVSGVTSIVGILLEVTAASCFIIVSETHAAYGDEDEEHVGDLFRSLSLTFLLLGLVAFLLALLPTDRRAVPVGATILVVMIIIWVNIAVIFAVNLLLHPYTTDDTNEKPGYPIVEGCIALTLAFAGLCTAVYLIHEVTCRRRMPKRLLARMWHACGVFFLIVAVGTGTYVVFECIRSGADGLYYVSAMMTACMCARVARNPDFRPWVQSYLGSRAEAAGSAAAVAALVGDSSVDKVLEMARMHFHTVRADQICFEDLKSNEPDAEIGMKSRKTRLGEADAFISHSWHDDPVEKWRALQAWRRKFRQENHGVEPKLWIDKYCIDQNDVENSLACLPIYLASCSRLVVICGETYLERLWCITELFVFLEMGGSPSNLEVIVLPDPCDKIAQKIKNFAPENARSFDMETTDILLGVLEAGRFGLEGIRKLVQDRFVPGSWQLVFETDPKAVTARSSSSLAAPDASGNDAKAVALRSTSSLKVPEAMINMVMQTKAYAAGSSSPKAPEAVVNAVVNETKAQACTSRSGSSLKAPSFISSETKAGTSRSSSSLAMRVLNFEALGPQLHPPAVREEDGSSEESEDSDTSEAGFSI